MITGNDAWFPSAGTLPPSDAGSGTRRLRRSRNVKIVIYFLQEIKLENCSGRDHIQTLIHSTVIHSTTMPR
jgi:hypothetical protein